MDDTGAVVGYNEFDPYGNAVAGGGDPYGFTGEWWQSEVSLLHLRARWYAPYLNQFISPDPIIPDYLDPQSLNKYAYSRNNPINRTDPSGLKSSNTSLCDNSPGCQVAVYNRKIQDPTNQSLPEFIAVHHTYLVYTDEKGKMTLFEAGPKPYLPGTGPIPGIDEGLLLGDQPREITQRDLSIKKAEFPVTNEVITKGKDFWGNDFCGKLACLQRVHDEINGALLHYHERFINSNGYIYTLLSRCSLPVETPTGANPGWVDVLATGPIIEEIYKWMYD